MVFGRTSFGNLCESNSAHSKVHILIAILLVLNYRDKFFCPRGFLLSIYRHNTNILTWPHIRI